MRELEVNEALDDQLTGQGCGLTLPLMTQLKETRETADAAERLTRQRAEKIAAIEGLHVSPRLARLLQESEHMSAEERRAYVASGLARPRY